MRPVAALKPYALVPVKMSVGSQNLFLFCFVLFCFCFWGENAKSAAATIHNTRTKDTQHTNNNKHALAQAELARRSELHRHRPARRRLARRRELDVVQLKRRIKRRAQHLDVEHVTLDGAVARDGV